MRNSDWEDDAVDMMQADKVFIEWTALAADGEIIFNSNATISPREAAAMFRAIGGERWDGESEGYGSCGVKGCTDCT